MSAPLHAFAGYGIELEYMIVDARTLDVLPAADRLLRTIAGSPVAEYANGAVALSNELVLHLIELKNVRPESGLDLKALSASFQSEVRRINALLAPMQARLMPAAMHPWMNPGAETQLWPHANAAIYQTYDRIFDCKRHGWANLQSMHLNLPFSGDEEFARLHAAVRLVLPILPALAASSPYADGAPSGQLDGRMTHYCTHQARVASTQGAIIPDTVTSRADYDANILQPMYREIAPLDPEGLLRHDWLNARGAVPRFERSAIEIRVLDVQECPAADCAIAAAVINVVGALYDGRTALSAQQDIATGDLAAIMSACIRDADEAVIDHAGYLYLLGFPGRRCEARELWAHLLATPRWDRAGRREEWRALDVILNEGPLARRILRATGATAGRARIAGVYRELCECLAEGRLFHG